MRQKFSQKKECEEEEQYPTDRGCFFYLFSDFASQLQLDFVYLLGIDTDSCFENLENRFVGLELVVYISQHLVILGITYFKSDQLFKNLFLFIELVDNMTQRSIARTVLLLLR